MRAERLASVGAVLAEGPVWRAESEEIVWVDIPNGEIFATGLAGTTRLVRQHAMPVGAVALGPGGEILASTPIGLVDEAGQVRAELPVEAPDLRANDGKPDPAGRFVGGTMTVGVPRPGAGSLWSLASDTATRLVADVTIANGLAWDASGETLYWIDTPTGCIDQFDYDRDTGSAVNRRSWVAIDRSVGSPDGMCIDAEGGLWVALWGGSAVHRYLEGRLDVVVEVPASQVTCPTFAGPELDRLVITTASIGLDPRLEGAGDLYVVETGPIGVPPGRLGSWAV
jgi:sugar lactone lactonase YvrE